MDAKTDMDAIEKLVKLQQIDRKRDRCQKKLDQVPVKLRRHTDAIAELERSLEERRQEMLAAKAEADRAELEVAALDQRREKIKQQMNAPKLSNREYEVLQEELAGVLADSNQHTSHALKSMETVAAAENALAELTAELDKAKAEYQAAKEKLEGSLSDVKEELEKHDAARAEWVPNVDGEALAIYERVRRKHKDALARVDGTIDRAAGRIGSDLHCAACYMSVTANDAIQVLSRKRIMQCKSCVRILYVP